MAGIGFELRKLFSNDEESAFKGIKAFLFSASTTVGPWIITATSLNLILFLSKKIIDLSRSNQILFMSTIFYIFIFSQIIVGSFQYLVTRFLSDCIYREEIHKIKATFIGVIKLTTIITFLVSVIFIRRGNLSTGYKISYVVLFVAMSLSWITMIFIALLKKYKFILFTFFVGNFSSVIFGYIFLKYPISFLKEDPLFYMLFSYTLGIVLNFILTAMYIMKAFPGKEKNHFEFLTYFKGYFSLVIIGTFYILGVWGHVFVNWLIGDSYLIANVFLVSPVYEVAVFYAYCTVVPSMIYFAVFMETKFLPIYRNYFNKICVLGKYDEVEESLKALKQTLIGEVLYSMELQLLLSITSILLANIIFNELDMGKYLLDLFRIVTFASYNAIFVSILITLFLYFDLRLQSVILAVTTFVTSFLFSFVFGKMGSEFTGFGFFISTLITFMVGVYMFYKLFDSLSYSTMFSQNFSYKVGGGIITKISQLFNKRVYIAIVVVILFLLGSYKVHAAYDERGFNPLTKNNRNTMSPFDKEGYDIDGYTSEGIDKRGFNRAYWHVATNSPYDYAGFNYEGIHKETGKNYDLRGFNYELFNIQTNSQYDKNGFNFEGIHKDTGREYDKNGWNYYGLNEETQDYYNKEGWNFEGINKRGFNTEGYNIETKSEYDNFGFSLAGIHKTTKTLEDERGFNYEHFNTQTNSQYDKNGFNFEGIHKNTGREYDENGWNYYGLNEETQDYYNKEGWSFEGINTKGFNKQGYNVWTKSKYDYANFDFAGINKNTRTKYDERGFDKDQIHKKTHTKYDENGFDYGGKHKDTGTEYDKNGWNFYGLNKYTNTYFDKSGYTREGLDKYGFKRGQRPKNFGKTINNSGSSGSSGSEYDKDGFDSRGVYRKGY